MEQRRNLQPREGPDYIIYSSCRSAASLVHYMTYMQSRAEQMVTASLQRGSSCVGIIVSLEKVEALLCVTLTPPPSQPGLQNDLAPRRMRGPSPQLGHDNWWKFCGVILYLWWRACHEGASVLNPAVFQQTWKAPQSEFTSAHELIKHSYAGLNLTAALHQGKTTWTHQEVYQCLLGWGELGGLLASVSIFWESAEAAASALPARERQVYF